jgi:hypothetical protein
VNAPGAEAGNCLVFKPSPLSGLRKDVSQASVWGSAGTVGPLDVTAAPLANPRGSQRGQENLTTFIAAPLPAPAPLPPSQLGADAPETAEAVKPKTGSQSPTAQPRVGWMLVLLLAVVAAVAVAVLWPDSLGLR